MNPHSPRFVLVMIFVLFFTPVLLAVLMHSRWWNFEPSSLSNLGELVEPPVTLPLAELAIQHPPAAGALNTGQWTLLYPFGSDCADSCLRDAATLRQIHLATGRRKARVAIVMVSRHELAPAMLQKLVNIYPEIIIAHETGHAATAALTQAAGRVANEGLGVGRVFLLDPAGNIILRYARGFDANHINKDLKQLLTWSAQDGAR